MKEVEEFTYLRSVRVSKGKFTQDIERRRAAVSKALGTLRHRVWGRREVTFKVKTKVFSAGRLSVLLCGETAWVLTKTEEIRLGALEMGMLRNIEGVRLDKLVQNDDIRAVLCHPPFSVKLRGARMKWFGLFWRKGQIRQVKRIMNAEMQGRYPVERSRPKRKDVL